MARIPYCAANRLIRPSVSIEVVRWSDLPAAAGPALERDDVTRTTTFCFFLVRFNFPNARNSIRVLLFTHDHIQLFRAAMLVGFDFYRVVFANLNFFVNLGSAVHNISNLNLGFTLNGDASPVARFAC